MSDYKIGYGKPPKTGQIRKGEVRNPWGRHGKKRKAVALPPSETDLLNAINTEAVEVDGRLMTRREAYIRLQYAAALKGKPAAIRFIDGLAQGSAPVGGGVLVVPFDGDLDTWDPQVAIEQANKERHKP